MRVRTPPRLSDVKRKYMDNIDNLNRYIDERQGLYDRNQFDKRVSLENKINKSIKVLHKRNLIGWLFTNRGYGSQHMSERLNFIQNKNKIKARLNEVDAGEQVDVYDPYVYADNDDEYKNSGGGARFSSTEPIERKYIKNLFKLNALYRVMHRKGIDKKSWRNYKDCEDKNELLINIMNNNGVDIPLSRIQNKHIDGRRLLYHRRNQLDSIVNNLQRGRFYPIRHIIKDIAGGEKIDVPDFPLIDINWDEEKEEEEKEAGDGDERDDQKEDDDDDGIAGEGGVLRRDISKILGGMMNPFDINDEDFANLFQNNPQVTENARQRGARRRARRFHNRNIKTTAFKKWRITTAKSIKEKRKAIKDSFKGLEPSVADIIGEFSLGKRRGGVLDPRSLGNVMYKTRLRQRKENKEIKQKAWNKMRDQFKVARATRQSALKHSLKKYIPEVASLIDKFSFREIGSR